ncbi:MAG: alpha-1,2-fucosyltransferase [Prevotellaceae bacterium]|jgi:hypothetical protein|nr:alpha-1,2-fucosyltransferase [Prevotellaceae bacterium]
MKKNGQKQLIIIKPKGNHSNSLLQNVHFEAFCLDNKIEFRNPTFGDMAELYAAPCRYETNFWLKFLQINLLFGLFRHSRVVKRIFSVVWLLSKIGLLKFIRFDKKFNEEYYRQILLKAFEKHDIVYAAGWWFELPKEAKKLRANFQKKYALKPQFYEDNPFVEKINRLKSENYTLIGVHIRRGDYKKWKGGKYFFSNEIYQKQIDNIAEKLSAKGENRQIFILFSNEELQFQKPNNWLISKEKWFIDHHIMSLCDILTGPPSTFTLWANYIGCGKLFFIVDKNGELIEQNI